MKYLYWLPFVTPGTSTDQFSVPPSFVRLVMPQLLKVPRTAAEVACGDQTRNVTPVPRASAKGVAPIPGRDAWAGERSATQNIAAATSAIAANRGRRAGR